MATALEPAADRILTAALSLIDRHGLGRVTISAIAAAAGVARQTVYNHYPDVDSIVAEAVRRHDEASVAMLETALSIADSPTDQIEALVRHMVTIGAHAGHSRDVQVGLAADTRATLGEYADRIRRRIGEALEAGMVDGSFRSDLDPARDTMLVQHLLGGVSALAARDADDAAAIAATGRRTIMAALQSRSR